MLFDPDRHHHRSIRLRGYDYAQAGAYFVTICTDQRQLFFDGSELRQIAEKCWLAIPDFNPGVELDEWVVMPNHVHGIVVLAGGQGVFSNAPTPSDAPTTRDVSNRFSVMSPQRGTLGLVIRKFKSAVTGNCRGIKRFDFAWQGNYYDHIIRNERELNAIREYIVNNPAKWALDRDNLADSTRRPPPKIIDDYLRDAGL
jgi:REP element-mobilizing transposase RayT